MNRPSHLPVSTYRLQVYAAFTLRHAARVVPYLQRLADLPDHQRPDECETG